MSAFHGHHLLGSYFECDSQALEDVAALSLVLREAAEASGATILRSLQHLFSPKAATILLLLSESHASIHTYPEHRSCFVDLFTCGVQCRADRFDECLRAYLKPRTWSVQIHERGIAPQEALPAVRAVG